jgi:hypothetical protein
MGLRDERILEIGRGSTSSHSVENWLGKRVQNFFVKQVRE